MSRRMIPPVLFGAIGAAILIALGVWQMQRLAWKEGVLAQIEARIAAPPTALPAAPDPETDRYRPVAVTGRVTEDQVRVLASVKGVGAVHRIVAAVQTEDGRRVLADLGYAPTAAEARARTGPAEIRGNLHWPDEVDGWTPAPDIAAGLWFARDVPALAETLATEPVLIVARQVQPPDPALTPLAVGTEGIPNDHLGYAVTWFSLAAVWLGMTGFLLWRIRRRGL